MERDGQTITLRQQQRCARCGMDIPTAEARWVSAVSKHIVWHVDEMRCIQVLVEYVTKQGERIEVLTREGARH